METETTVQYTHSQGDIQDRARIPFYRNSNDSKHTSLLATNEKAIIRKFPSGYVSWGIMADDRASELIALTIPDTEHNTETIKQARKNPYTHFLYRAKDEVIIVAKGEGITTGNYHRFHKILSEKLGLPGTGKYEGITTKYPSPVDANSTYYNGNSHLIRLQEPKTTGTVSDLRKSISQQTILPEAATPTVAGTSAISRLEQLKTKQESPKPSGSVEDKADISTLSAKYLIRLNDLIEKQPVCLFKKENGYDAVLCTLGNFSVVIGKQKSRKTFFVSAQAAAFIKRDGDVLGMWGALPAEKQQVLFFDCEQSPYDAQQVLKRIWRMAGITNQELEERLQVRALRPEPPNTRLDIIRHLIETTPNVGVVIIDGIRDTVFDINDQTEATRRATDLMQWTGNRGIHLITIIHQNKADDNARGAIGTELVNKAESVIEVARHKTDKRISEVIPKDMRNREFEPFMFSIEDNLPVLVEGSLPVAEQEAPKRRKLEPKDLSNAIHRLILISSFDNEIPGNYPAMWGRIKHSGAHHGYTMGDNVAKDFLTFYLSKGWLTSPAKKGDKYTFQLPKTDNENEDQV